VTVHVLIPVFNRLALTCRVLDCLQNQQLDEPLRLLVIDDGSTDGTAEYLASQQDITVIKGSGSLWWGGAIEAGLQRVLQEGHPSDWILLVNNDTQFAADFVQRLLDTARTYAPAAVGSVICDEAAPDRLLSIGAMFDTWRLRVRDKLEQELPRHLARGPHWVDALSGRGTLYPLAAFRIAGTMKPAWLPHYLADYELAVRVRKAGFKLVVTENAVILSADEYGNSYKPESMTEKFFSVRSACYLPAVLAFWWRTSTFFEKLTLLPRLVFVGFKSRLFF
jgi:N-acetylglucosaminyl-diphospho-decaprenol L-rhamnosyltransferase